MSKASEWADRWQEVAARHPGKYATPEEIAYIGSVPEWAPEGCNWAARVNPDGKLVLAAPEIGGISGKFRDLTEQEFIARNEWIAATFETSSPLRDYVFNAEIEHRWIRWP